MTPEPWLRSSHIVICAVGATSELAACVPRLEKRGRGPHELRPKAQERQRSRANVGRPDTCRGFRRLELSRVQSCVSSRRRTVVGCLMQCHFFEGYSFRRAVLNLPGFAVGKPLAHLRQSCVRRAATPHQSGLVGNARASETKPLLTSSPKRHGSCTTGRSPAP